MSGIQTHRASLEALRNLQASQGRLTRVFERLSTGQRVNRASDDPAALVVSERLRSQIGALRKASDGSERSQNLVNTAEAALAEAGSLLVSMKALALEAANGGAISAEEIDANQAQIDSAVESIARIANATKFASRKLLDGSRGYVQSSVTASIQELSVFGASFGTQSQLGVTLRMTQSAQYATVVQNRRGTSAGSAITLQITGNRGTAVVVLGASTGNSAIRAAVNAVRESTGVSAVTSTTISGGIFFYSTSLGGAQIVSVQDLDSDGNSTRWINARDQGRDAAGTLNGTAATARGAELTVRTSELNLTVGLRAGLNKSSGTTTFWLTSGGMRFQLGSASTADEQAGLGIQSVDPSVLGNASEGLLSQIVTGGAYDLRTDAARASRILDAALDEISALRGRLGAFSRNTLETNAASLLAAVENLQAADSRIRDADFAGEVAQMTRYQILVQAGTSILGQANLVPQTVLQLLGSR